MLQTRLSRRRLLSVLATTFFVGLTGCDSAGTPNSVAPTKLQFVDSPFDAANTGALLHDFQGRNPSVAVQRTEISTDHFLTDLIASVASGTTQDLAFVPSSRLAQLVDGGWVRELGGLPGASSLNAAELSWAREQTTINGTRYGALAWVRLHGFFYNRTYLGKVGQSPPTSFDSLKTAAEAIERDHLGNYPFYWPLKNGPGIFADDYLSAGNPMFDAQLIPLFARDPIYLDVLNWRLRAIYDWNLVDPRGLSNQRDDDQSYPHGWAAFTWDTYDRLRLWQTSGQYLQSGHLANGLVPSQTSTHVAIGDADLLAIPVTARQNDAAWELLYFLSAGEDYRAARLRWRQSGLLFGYTPLVSDDALFAQGSEWADVSVLRAQLTQVCPPPAVGVPWRDEWLSYARIQSALLIRQIVSPSTFIRRLAGQWDSLRAGTAVHQP